MNDRAKLERSIAALQRCIDRVRTLDDCGAESGSSWQSAELESDIESADEALAHVRAELGLPPKAT